MAVYKTVSLFGAGPYDGIRLNVFVVDAEPTPQAMQQMVQQSTYQSGLFVYPLQTTNSFTMQYFHPTLNNPLPLISSYAAALAIHSTLCSHSITIVENKTPYEFLISKYPHIQVTLPLPLPHEPLLHDTMDELERIVVLDIFGIVRRGLVFDYSLADQLLIVYANEMTVQEAQQHSTCRPAPGHPQRSDRLDQCRWQRQRISHVALCVYNEQTGGVFAKVLSIDDAREYRQEPGLTLPIAMRLQNIWDPQSPIFEISWHQATASSEKPCYLVKHVQAEKQVIVGMGYML